MNTNSQTLTITNEIAEITRAAEFIEGFCTAQRASPDIAFKVNLAVEEALVNTISYGFKDDTRHTIELNIAREDNAIILTITDDAVAFNPLEAELPDVDAAVEDRKVGGLGVFLVRTTMDKVQYIHEDGQNKLTLTKRL
ncbi:MAG: ATP-binding protein [Pseudomonadota bacterium]